MFVNVSNHLSYKWGLKQRQDAMEFGDIVDIPFPEINPYWSSAEIDDLVDKYYEQILGIENPVVMLQGEYLFTYRLINKLKSVGIKVVASCSDRRTIEYIDENGYTARRSEFEFVNFKEY